MFWETYSWIRNIRMRMKNMMMDIIGNIRMNRKKNMLNDRKYNIRSWKKKERERGRKIIIGIWMGVIRRFWALVKLWGNIYELEDFR